MPSELQKKIERAMARLGNKVAFAPTGSMPAPDPAAGGAPMPPMDPAAMGGGMPPMDPAAMGGAMPPMDPAMMGGMPPADPATMGGMPPMDPAAMGGAGAPPPPGLQGASEDPMQMISDLNDKIDAIGDLLMKVCRHFNISLAEDEESGAESLVNDEELDKIADAKEDAVAADEPLSDQAQEAIGGNDFIKKQLEGLGGGY